MGEKNKRESLSGDILFIWKYKRWKDGMLPATELTLVLRNFVPDNLSGEQSCFAFYVTAAFHSSTANRTKYRSCQLDSKSLPSYNVQ